MLIKIVEHLGTWGHVLAWACLILFRLATSPFGRNSNPIADLLAVLTLALFLGALVANIYLLTAVRRLRPLAPGIYIYFIIQVSVVGWIVWLFGFSDE